MAISEDWVADLLKGYTRITEDGTPVVPRKTLDLIGASVEDDPNYADPLTGEIVGRTRLTVDTGDVQPFLLSILRTTVPGGAREVRFVDGFHAQGDGGQGSFVWNNTDTRADNGGTIVAVGGVATGRWNRIYERHINARWFGCKGDGQRVSDAACAASTTLTSATARFVATDQSKLWTLYKIGGNVVATGTITAVVSATQVTLSGAPSITSGTRTITNVTNATPAVVTTSTTHGLSTGDYVTIDGVVGATGANGTIAVTVLSGTTFSVPPAAGGAYDSGGTVTYGGFFVWGSDDTTALTSWLAAVKSASSSALTVGPEAYLPPGNYCTTVGYAIDPDFNGCAFAGGSFWHLNSTAAKITLMRPAAYLVQNTADGLRWSDLWLDGNRLATNVLDFEYFGDTQTFDRCRFSGGTNAGNLHYYGNLNGALEIDFITFRDCFLYADFYDARYYVNSCILNENPQAFQINYENGLMRNGSTIATFTQGSCNIRGTQMFGWVEAAIKVNTGCASFELADIYNEQDTSPFFKVIPSSGATFFTVATLRNLHLQGTGIYTCHTMRIEMLGCTLADNITSDPEAATFTGANGTIAYGVQPLILDNCSLENGAAVLYSSGIAGQLVELRSHGSYGAQTVDHSDAAITVSTKALACTTSTPFSAQSVGMPVHVVGAGSGGNDLWSWITGFTDSGHVTINDSAGASVTGAVIHIGNVGTLTPFGYGQQVTTARSPTEQVGSSGYDAGGVYLATGQTRVGVGVPMVAADCHVIGGLTSDRAYVISQLTASLGSRMQVARGSDAFKATVTYGTTPTTVVLTRGMRAEFEFFPDSGWTLLSVGLASAPAFSPLTLPGVVLWLVADRGIVSNAGLVSGWADQSGNGNHAIQSTGGNQPAIIASSILGNAPAVRFDGAASFMSFPRRVPGADSYVGTVAAVINNVTYSGTGSIFSGRNYRLLNIIGGQWAMYQQQTGNGEAAVLSTATPYSLVGSQASQTSRTLYTNGATVTDNNSGAAPTDGAAVSVLGSNYGGASQFGNVDIAELVVSTAAWSASQVAAWRSYVSTRYGFSA